MKKENQNQSLINDYKKIIADKNEVIKIQSDIILKLLKPEDVKKINFGNTQLPPTIERMKMRVV